MAQKKADVVLDLSIALWVIMVLLIPEQRKKNLSQAHRNISLKIARIFPLSDKIIVILVFSDKTRNFTVKILLVDT